MEIARAALRISHWKDDRERSNNRLVFDMLYATEHGAEEIGHVDGLVLVHGSGFFSLAGVDMGSFDSASLYIFPLPSLEQSPVTQHGVMLRVNTRKRIVAARVLMQRLTPLNGRPTEGEIEKKYKEAQSRVEIVSSPHALDQIRAEIQGIDALLNNRVDNQQRYVLLDTAPASTAAHPR